MAYDKTIFINYATQQRIKSSGAQDTSPLKICYQDYATWRIYFYDVNGTTLTPKDLSLAVAWRAAIDKDFSGATEPMCRALDAAIDKSGLADGYIDVSLDADTSTFLAAFTGNTSGEMNCYFEVMGFDVTAKRIFYLRFTVACQNVVDPNTGTPGDPVSNYYVKTEVDALLRAGRDLQYSVDGSTLWHSTQVDADRYWRERYPDGEWSAAMAMVVGPAGADAPATQIQYSIDGATDWHSTFTAGDLYQRVSVDGGSTWSDAMEFVGADGADGDDGWTPVIAIVSDGDRRVLQVTDWTGGEGTKPATGNYVGATGFVSNIADAIDIRGSTGATGAAGADAPEVQIQYSSDNASFHSPKVSADVYMRISTDGGSTWTSGMEFTSSGVNTDVEFDNTDLVAGVLTITGTRRIVDIVDNNGKVIFPDEITYGSTDTTVDLTSFGTLSGTWKVIFAQGKDGADGADGEDGTNGTNGTNAPATQIQYSVDGSTSWHSSFTSGDLYLRVSVDGGSTWSDAMKFVGEDGADGADGDMVNPMTTAGDVIYGGASGTPARLAAGTAGQVLKMNSGATAPEWGDAVSAGGSDGATISLTGDRTMAASEVGKHFDYTSSTAATKTLTLATPPANNSAPVWIKNSSAYNITVSGHINGTASSSFTLYPDCTIKLISEGSTWRIVMERWEPSTATSSHTFSSLNGNTDIRYLIVSRVIANGTIGQYQARLNNDSGRNYSAKSFAGYGSTDQENNRQTWTGLDIGYTGDYSTQSFNTTEIWAKSGVNRIAKAHWTRASDTHDQGIGIFGEIWLNTADNITSIVVAAPSGGNFGVGSCVELWKLTQ